MNAASLPPEPNGEEPVLDPGIMEEMGLVPAGGSGELPAGLVALFLGEERPRLERLARLVAERDAAELARLVHNLAGSSAILGARQVQKAALALELAARAGDWGPILAQWAILQAAWVRLEAALAPDPRP